MIIKSKQSSVVEYGDYQTPMSFTDSVCDKLKAYYNLDPTVILEPTFGLGNFIESALSKFKNTRQTHGIEINPEYFFSAQERLLSSNFNPMATYLYNEDIFSFDFSSIKKSIAKEDSVLILGNPPWVTNSRLSTINSHNTPMKENFKKYSGLDAITGKGNFDIAEYIILQLLSEFSGYNCTLAMLCKTIVAKNIIRDINKYSFKIDKADLHVFDANEVFGVSCDSALFVVKLGQHNSRICNVYNYYTDERERQFGWYKGVFLSDISASTDTEIIDGKCQFEWRQGVKHDCSKVMELETRDDGKFVNGFEEVSELPIGQFIFPLIKSSDIKMDEITKTRKHVIITQRRVNADTSIIEHKSKDVWDYLMKYEKLLNARKSIIYRKSPQFSIFGIGDYSFSKYKVGISGFYKEPRFALIVGDIPVMLDDTCYFLSFNTIEDAIITLALLNSSECQKFLKSVAFLDSKRPYTKEILKRINILSLSELYSFDYVRAYALKLEGKYNISHKQYQNYIEKLDGEFDYSSNSVQIRLSFA